MTSQFKRHFALSGAGTQSHYVRDFKSPILSIRFLSFYDFLLVGNHRKLALHSGYQDIREYRYYNAKTNDLDLEGMINDLRVCRFIFLKQCGLMLLITKYN